jgi:hypothetical protein
MVIIPHHVEYRKFKLLQVILKHLEQLQYMSSLSKQRDNFSIPLGGFMVQ